jgi:molecular chaperone GrpE
MSAKKHEEQPVSETAQPDAAEGPVQAETGAGAAGGDEVEALRAELEAARAKADENCDRLLRVQAELENLRKRSARELESARKYALEKLAAELLQVRDSLELGLSAAREQATAEKLLEGTELTLKVLTQVMEKFSITELDPVGEPFNPELHQAVAMQESEQQSPDTVLSVMQKGYMLNDRLLRPAMVVVAK